MTPHPDRTFRHAERRLAATPTLADRPPIVTPKDICNCALPLLEANWTSQGARDAEDRSCNALSPRARHFSLDAALRRATYDLRGRQFRNWLDPEDTAGAALTALSGHIHSMLSKALPPDRPLAFDTVCNTQEIAAAVLFSAASSLPEYPGLRPRTAIKRRQPGVHAFLVEGRGSGSPSARRTILAHIWLRRSRSLSRRNHTCGRQTLLRDLRVRRSREDAPIPYRQTRTHRPAADDRPLAWRLAPGPAHPRKPALSHRADAHRASGN